MTKVSNAINHLIKITSLITSLEVVNYICPTQIPFHKNKMG